MWLWRGHRRDFQERRRVQWVDHLRQDVRCAIRSGRKTPIAALVAITSLAAGIAATTATLTLRNAIFYNPPPLYLEPSQLSRVAISTLERPRGLAPGALYDVWAGAANLQGRIAGATGGRTAQVRWGDRRGTLRLRGVTEEFFDVLGVQAWLGRTFSRAPTADGASPLVLGYQVWQMVFDSRPDIVGAIVWLDDQPYTVTGVMPERFWFGSTNPVAWTLLPPRQAAEEPALDIVVRRPAGGTVSDLREQLQRDAAEYTQQHQATFRELNVLVKRVGGTELGDQLSFIIPWLVGAAVFLTLLIACANVTILMFARWTVREREMAIRSSLGASRMRVMALLLTESIVLAVCGGALGLLATFALRGLFVRNAQGAAYFDLSIDYLVLVQAAAVTLAAGLLSGLAPAIYETRRLHVNPLRLLASSDRTRQRWRHALVVLEIAVTVALMIAAASQVDASRRVLTANLGFATAPLVTVHLENSAGIEVPQVLDAIARVPGVLSAAAGTSMPLGGDGPSDTVVAPASASVAVQAARISITPAYFMALDVPILAGRTFTESDSSGTARVAIVNEPLARRLWPGRDAIDQRIVIGRLSYEVVGVAAGYRSSPFRPSMPRYYLPLPHEPKPAQLPVVVRAAHTPRDVARAIRPEVQRLGATYTVRSASAMSDVIEVGSREMLALAVAMSPLLGIGIFLTATGIFGVLAFSIARQSRDLAVRMALGASRRSVGRRVVGRTLQLLTAGALVGVVVTFSLTRMVRSAGGGGSSFQTPGWEAFAVPVLIVVVIGGLATWIPVRRATCVDPAILLKTE